MFRNRLTQSGSKNAPREMNIFLFIHSGAIDFVYADGTRLRAEAKNMLYIPKGTVYTSIYVEDNTEITSIQFQMQDENGDFTFADSIELLPSTTAKQLEVLFTEFHSILPTELQFINRARKLYSLIESLNRLLNKSSYSLQYTTILPGVELLINNFCKNIPISEIAAAATVSECYFRRIFKQHFNVSPIEYRNQLRLAYVDELLQSGLYTCGEAIEAAGFLNASHYYKIKRRK